MRNRFGISISMDGPPEIQNRNRPLAKGGGSSQIVESSVKYLVSNNYPFSIRLTYSAIDNITRILEYLAYLGVRRIHLEPLFPHGREYQTVVFGKKSLQPVYAPSSAELLKKFLEALDAASTLGIKIYNGHLAQLRKGTGYFCGAASGNTMIVTHDGHLTGCLEVVDARDNEAQKFFVGTYLKKKGEFWVNRQKIATMRKRHADAITECKTCYARYTCAGGCAVKAVRATSNFLGRDLPYCSFTRALLPVVVKRIAVASGV